MIVSSSPLPLRTHPRKHGLALDIYADQRQGARQRQEDACLVRRRAKDVLVAVADGVSAHPAGDEAARLALEALNAAFPAEEGAVAPLAMGARLTEGFVAAHRAVTQFGRALGAGGRPCTTLLAALIQPRLGVFGFASAGDSHLYVTGPRRPLTRLNAARQAAGAQAAGPWNAARHNAAPEPEAGRLAGCVGGDLAISGADELYLLHAGETLLFATDGLDVLSPGLIEDTLRAAPSARSAAWSLLGCVEARRHPRQGNTSLLVVRLPPATSPAHG